MRRDLKEIMTGKMMTHNRARIHLLLKKIQNSRVLQKRVKT